MQRLILKIVLTFIFLAFTSAQYTFAQEISPKVKLQVEKYKISLTYWATNPLTIATAKKALNKGGIPGFTNSFWDMLPETDTRVIAIKHTRLSKQLSEWEKDKNIVKLNLRDTQGNLIAFASNSPKPLLYNNANRAPFLNGLKGPWSDDKISIDPSTQQDTVQIAVPVMDGNKVIGVLHSAVLAE